MEVHRCAPIKLHVVCHELNSAYHKHKLHQFRLNPVPAEQVSEKKGPDPDSTHFRHPWNWLELTVNTRSTSKCFQLPKS